MSTKRMHRPLTIEELEPRVAPAVIWDELGLNAATAGGISDNSGWSTSPAIGVGTDGNPIIAWADQTGGNSEVYVRRWTGSSWAEMGAGSASGGGISNTTAGSYTPGIAIGSNNRPFVVWSELGANWEIYGRQWDGASWVELAGSASGAIPTRRRTAPWSPWGPTESPSWRGWSGSRPRRTPRSTSARGMAPHGWNSEEAPRATASATPAATHSNRTSPSGRMGTPWWSGATSRRGRTRSMSAAGTAPRGWRWGRAAPPAAASARTSRARSRPPSPLIPTGPSSSRG